MYILGLYYITRMSYHTCRAIKKVQESSIRAVGRGLILGVEPRNHWEWDKPQKLRRRRERGFLGLWYKPAVVTTVEFRSSGRKRIEVK